MILDTIVNAKQYRGIHPGIDRILEAGSFIVLFPQDAHAPGCITDHPEVVKKIVGKVRIICV